MLFKLKDLEKNKEKIKDVYTSPNQKERRNIPIPIKKKKTKQTTTLYCPSCLIPGDKYEVLRNEVK